MTDKQPGLIRRFFGAIWTTINFTRRLVVNALFLILLLVFIGALVGGAPALAPHTALVLDPQGAIVNQYTSDPSQRAFSNLFGEKIHEVQMRDILNALDAAAKDSHIDRLVIVPDDITSVGFSSLREIGAAIDRFKASGKEVIALSQGMTQSQYYLATHADKVWLDPQGVVLLEGLGRYRSYYKEALDKLEIDVHLFRVGEYKSAGEPFILNQASKEAREADLFWMNDVWRGFLADIAETRKLPVSALTDSIAHFGELVKSNHGDLANVALQQKWVDELVTRDQARERLIALGEKDEHKHTFRQIDLKSYVALNDHELLSKIGAQVAVVVAEGEILPGEQPPGSVGGESTAQLIRDARENDQVKALVLRVNSPGGEVFASEQIRREVELTKMAGKPVTVSMGDVAASGGYWISMNADEIFAEPTTITGSIGIFGLFMSVPKTLAKIGIHVDGVGTTPMAGAFDPRRPFDPKLGEMIQSVINKGYQDFITHVAAARNKTPDEIDAIARGRVWSGAQAKERGLVDNLGSLNDAIAAAAARANLGEDYHVHYVEKEMSPWERVALSFSSSATAAAFAHANIVLPGWLAPMDLQRSFKFLSRLSTNKVGVFAYCFCEMK